MTERWTLTSLMLRHRRASAAAITIVLVAIGLTIVTTVSGHSRQPLSDATTCTAWASATRSQKVAYAQLYINEHGAFPNTPRYGAAVQTAIDRACTHASYLGEADDISVLASIRHAF